MNVIKPHSLFIAFPLSLTSHGQFYTEGQHRPVIASEAKQSPGVMQEIATSPAPGGLLAMTGHTASIDAFVGTEMHQYAGKWPTC